MATGAISACGSGVHDLTRNGVSKSFDVEFDMPRRENIKCRRGAAKTRPCAGFLLRAAQAVEAMSTEANMPLLETLYAAPTKPRWMLVKADGTSWNPGSGAGFYGGYREAHGANSITPGIHDIDQAAKSCALFIASIEARRRDDAEQVRDAIKRGDMQLVVFERGSTHLALVTDGVTHGNGKKVMDCSLLAGMALMICCRKGCR